MPYWLAILSALFLGGIMGFFLCGLLRIAKDADERAEWLEKRKNWRNS